MAPDGETVVRRIGQGDHRGATDSTWVRSRFNEPQGLCLLPPGTADYDVVVADTVNHLLRGLRLDTGEVVTVAGRLMLIAPDARGHGESGRPADGYAPADFAAAGFAASWRWR